MMETLILLLLLKLTGVACLQFPIDISSFNTITNKLFNKETVHFISEKGTYYSHVVKDSYQSITHELQNGLSSSTTKISSLLDELHLPDSITASKKIFGNVLNIPDISQKSSLYTLITSTEFQVIAPFVVIPFIFGCKSYADSLKEAAPSTPYPSGKYNVTEANEYFKYQQQLIASRSIRLFSLSAVFGFNLLTDYFQNILTNPLQEEKRASELTDLLTKLGPSFIKAGQSLSIRTDLLRPAYYKALSRLQDKVPSFPTALARKIIQEELGERIETIFASGLEPAAVTIAAASLGQVYRVELADGTEAAVKVQRPDILYTAALDMYLIRKVVPLLKSIFQLQTDVVGLVDEWATGFIDELDYVEEAKNAELFTKSILTTPLADKVFAPEVIFEYCSKRVLTTRWVDGVKIEKSDKSDVPAFCALAMNSYLTMMLETGILHCDPHPGNLFITPDGRLCILDWGLVTRLDSNIQATFITHIAHLTSKDYAAIPDDLVKLGFIAAGKESMAREAGVVEVLTSVYGQLAGGGGLKKINVAGVIDELTGLTSIYGNLFQIPAYFAYIARAFGVLEGIGLSYNPEYAIIGECLPYISQRLLADTSEETGKVLETFIFGASRDDPLRVIDAQRFGMLISGYNRYSLSSTEGISTTTKKKSASLVERADAFMDITTSLLLSTRKESSPLQNIVIEEVAKVLSASARSTFIDLKRRSGNLPNGRSVIGTLLDPFNILPMKTLFQPDDYDDKVLAATQSLLLAVSNSSSFDSALDDLTAGELRELVFHISGRLLQRRSGLISLSTKVSSKMLKQNMHRLDSLNLPFKVTDLESPAKKAWTSTVVSMNSRFGGARVHNLIQPSMKFLPLDSVLDVSNTLTMVSDYDFFSRFGIIEKTSRGFNFLKSSASSVSSNRLLAYTTGQSAHSRRTALMALPPSASAQADSTERDHGRNVSSVLPISIESGAGVTNKDKGSNDDPTSPPRSENGRKYKTVPEKSNELLSAILKQVLSEQEPDSLQSIVIECVAKLFSTEPMKSPSRRGFLNPLSALRRLTPNTGDAALLQGMRSLVLAVRTSEPFTSIVEGLSARQLEDVYLQTGQLLMARRAEVQGSPSRGAALLRQRLVRLKKNPSSSLLDELKRAPKAGSPAALVKTIVDTVQEIVPSVESNLTNILADVQKTATTSEADQASTYDSDVDTNAETDLQAESDLKAETHLKVKTEAAEAAALVEARAQVLESVRAREEERRKIAEEAVQDEREALLDADEDELREAYVAKLKEIKTAEERRRADLIRLESVRAEQRVNQQLARRAEDQRRDSDLQSAVARDKETERQAVVSKNLASDTQRQLKEADLEKNRTHASVITMPPVEPSDSSTVKFGSVGADSTSVPPSEPATGPEMRLQLEKELSSALKSASKTSKKKSPTVNDRAEEFTEAIMAVLLSDGADDPSPQQQLLIEEVAKVVSAGTRSTLGEIKRRSGTLPNGRSVVETLIDPFNILPTSILFGADNTDKLVLEATQHLIAVVGNDTSFKSILEGLTPKQAQDLGVIVAKKLLGRSAELLELTGRISAEIVKQNMRRLEKPSSSAVAATETTKATVRPISAVSRRSTWKPAVGKSRRPGILGAVGVLDGLTGFSKAQVEYLNKLERNQ